MRRQLSRSPPGAAVLGRPAEAAVWPSASAVNKHSTALFSAAFGSCRLEFLCRLIERLTPPASAPPWVPAWLGVGAEAVPGRAACTQEAGRGALLSAPLGEQALGARTWWAHPAKDSVPWRFAREGGAYP